MCQVLFIKRPFHGSHQTLLPRKTFLSSSREKQSFETKKNCCIYSMAAMARARPAPRTLEAATGMVAAPVNVEGVLIGAEGTDGLTGDGGGADELTGGAGAGVVGTGTSTHWLDV